MNLARLASTVAKATRTNATAMQSIRDEYAAIALEVATSADAGKELNEVKPIETALRLPPTQS